MQSLLNIPAPILNAVAVGATAAFFAFPVLLLAFGVFLVRAGRQGHLTAPALSAGRWLLGASLAALLLLAVGSLMRLPAAEWVSVALLAAGLALCGWLLCGVRVRPLRGITWALFGDILLLTAFLPFAIWVANLAQRITSYSNLNETEVRAALAKNPNDAAAHSSLAQIDRERGDHAGEVAEYRQVLRVEPDNQDALLLLGGRLTRAGRIDEARPLYQKLAADNGPYVDAARRWLARNGGH